MFPTPILLTPTPTPMLPISIPPTPTPMFPIPIPLTPTPMFPIPIPPTPTPMFPFPIPPSPTLELLRLVELLEFAKVTKPVGASEAGDKGSPSNGPMLLKLPQPGIEPIQAAQGPAFTDAGAIEGSETAGAANVAKTVGASEPGEEGNLPDGPIAAKAATASNSVGVSCLRQGVATLELWRLVELLELPKSPNLLEHLRLAGIEPIQAA
ncbi:hypothetical protein EDB89DRAFT_2063195 [Lactarius sanguifluus]|nr:hypothetical protein EDB89DRAFT_2063195 [Lactarius sanguifluus]